MADEQAKSTIDIRVPPLASSPTAAVEHDAGKTLPATSPPPETSQPRPAGDHQLQPGDMVAEYRITGLLGKGGMGTVYGGVQPVIGKRVAIKVLQGRYAADEEVVRRFVQEARAVNQANSSHIVDIFSFGTLPSGAHYFVMEQLEGQSLRGLLKTSGAMSFEDGATILRSVAKGLLAAHEQGIVHRDLKPGNIMIVEDDDGSLIGKVLDFGIAKLQRAEAPDTATKTGTAMGTPYYMSPEQCRGVDVDHRTDIYALGVLMFEVFTGKLPFSAPTYVELISQHLLTPPPRPSTTVPEMSPQLEAFILCCLAKNPDERPQTMQDFLAQLEQVTPAARTTRRAPNETLAAAVMSTLPTPDLPDVPEDLKNGPIKRLAQDYHAPTSSPAKRQRWRPWVFGGLVVVSASIAGALFVRGRSSVPAPTLVPTATRPGATQKSAPAKTKPSVAKTKPSVAKTKPSVAKTRPSVASTDEERRPQSVLRITTGTTNAEYLLDGSLVGRGPRLDLHGVSPGRHAISIRAPRIRPWRRTIQIEAGQRIDFDVQLQPKRRPRRPRPPRHTKPSPPTKPSLKDPDDTLDPFSR